jgi:hypothetical protein
LKNFGTLLGYEIKKLFLKRLNLLILAALLLLGVATGLLGGVTSGVTRFVSIDLEGSDETIELIKEYSPYEAMELNRIHNETLTGQQIDDEFLQKLVLAIFQATDTSRMQAELEAGADPDAVEADWEPISLYDTAGIWLMGFSDMTDDNTGEAITAEQLYQDFRASQKAIWSYDGLTQGEQTYWANQLDQIETPFTYAYLGGWSVILDNLKLYATMLLLAVTVCLAAHFPSEHQNRTDQMVYCTRNGRRGLFRSKLVSGLLFALLCWGVLMGAGVAAALAFYGADGADAMLQLYLWQSSLPLTMGQGVALLAVVLLLSALMTAAFALCCSELTRNAVPAVAAAALLLLGQMLSGMVPAFLQVGMRLFPMNLSTIDSLQNYHLTATPWGYLNCYETALPIYLVLTVAFGLVCWRCCQRHQVTGR